MSRFARSIRCLAIVCAAFLGAGPVTVDAAPAPLVIGNDHGGDVLGRVAAVRDLKRSGRKVRITGDICASACTLYLSLPAACVSPRTVFGFHGPSRHGTPLPPALFERASRIIAAHYPVPLRRWYMEVARHEIAGIHRLNGRDLVAMGVQPC